MGLSYLNWGEAHRARQLSDAIGSHQAKAASGPPEQPRCFSDCFCPREGVVAPDWGKLGSFFPEVSALSTFIELPRNINTKLWSILSFVELHGQMTSILAVSNDDPWRTLTHDDVAAIPRCIGWAAQKRHNMQHEQHQLQLRSKMSRLAAMSPQASWVNLPKPGFRTRQQCKTSISPKTGSCLTSISPTPHYA